MDAAARFQKEAPAAWERHRTAIRRLQGRNSHQRFKGHEPTGPAVETWSWEFKQAPGGMTRVVQTESVPWAPPERALVTNSRYAFEVKKQTKDGPWTLVDVQRGPEFKYELELAARDRAIADGFSALYQVGTRMLPNLVQHERWRVFDAESVRRGDKEFIKVHFEDRTPRAKRDTIDVSLDGWMLLDPAEEWVVKEADVNIVFLGSQKERRLVDNDYASKHENRAGIPIPRRRLTRTTTTSPTGESKECTVSTYEWEVQEYPPVRDFTLTAFGLQEPPGIDWSPPTPWWLYASSGGVALLIVAVVIYRLSRRAA
jgi:hypothetical protein